MNKILKVILAALLLLGTTSLVLAENQEISDEGEVLLFSNVSSYYIVRLPKVVDVSEDEVSFEIDAKGDIAGNEVLSIEVPEGMEIRKNVDAIVVPDTKPDRPSKPVCAIDDENCDGVITCAEKLGAYWVWDEAKGTCVYMLDGPYIPPTSTH